jgi:Zn-dependent peptidase ImmA (M78 family)
MARWDERMKRTRESAEELLQIVGIAGPPIPVERIAKVLGVQVRYVPYEGELSGLLFQDHEQVIIGVNSFDPKVRQRFTIAHELGHLRLHSRHEIHIDRNYRTVARDKRSSQAVDTAEIEANTFAAELLMPAKMLKRDLPKKQPIDYEDDACIRELAERYRVSIQAMVFRLTNLGLIEEIEL